MSRIYTEEEKQMHLDNYKVSGKSKKAYARENGIPETTFRGWLKFGVDSSSVGFGEIDISTLESTSGASKIYFNTEYIKIELTEGYDRKYLKKIVEAITYAK